MTIIHGAAGATDAASLSLAEASCFPDIPPKPPNKDGVVVDALVVGAAGGVDAAGASGFLPNKPPPLARRLPPGKDGVVIVGAVPGYAVFPILPKKLGVDEVALVVAVADAA